MTEYTDAQLIQRSIQIRDFIKAREEALAAELAPLRESKQIVDGELHRRLNERNSQSTSVQGIGTAYKSVNTSVKVVDREAFFNFVFASGASEFLVARAVQEAVETYIDANKLPPPGVQVDYIEKINVRIS